MKKKYFKSLGMTVCALVLVLFAVLMVSTVPAKADTGKTVRVSTVKELKSAMKKSGVGTIIFRTQAVHRCTCSSSPPNEIDKRLVQKEDVYFYKFTYQLQIL